jgi:hypothetical protein
MGRYGQFGHNGHYAKGHGQKYCFTTLFTNPRNSDIIYITTRSRKDQIK